MTRQEAEVIKSFIDSLVEEQGIGAIEDNNIAFTPNAQLKAPRTDGKRVIRTKSTGDRVYLIDETAKTKAWVTSPEILEKLGFTLNDVQDVDDSSLVGYAMMASVYKVDD